nr:reverse transcriptase domain-containing protein [Tanacetum cinerariifolium]
TQKDHFPLPFMDQMLERLAGNQYYCFLNGFSGYFQIPIDPKDQEKTTLTCPYGTFAYRRMPFGLCNAPGTFQRCMMVIFHDLIEKTMEVFMDDFSVFGDSFQSCLSHPEKMLKRCEDTNLCLNWEKSHFMMNTFYNALNPTDHDSLNAAAGAHPYYQCLAADGNTFPELRNNIQEYGSAAAANYNHGNPGYRPQGVANQMRPPGFVQSNVQNNQNRFGPLQGYNRGNNFNQELKNQIDMVKNELRNEMKTSIQTSLSNQTNEIWNMMASLLQMNTASPLSSGTLPSNTVANSKSDLKAIITRSGVSYDGPSKSSPVVENAPEATKDTVI